MEDFLGGFPYSKEVFPYTKKQALAKPELIADEIWASMTDEEEFFLRPNGFQYEDVLRWTAEALAARKG